MSLFIFCPSFVGVPIDIYHMLLKTLECSKIHFFKVVSLPQKGQPDDSGDKLNNDISTFKKITVLCISMIMW